MRADGFRQAVPRPKEVDSSGVAVSASEDACFGALFSRKRIIDLCCRGDYLFPAEFVAKVLRKQAAVLHKALLAAKNAGQKSAKDVVASANARGAMRHEMKGSSLADVDVLPSSGGESLEKSGIKDSGYLVKKGLEFGVTAFYNSLPPGMDIEDQENTDIRKQEMKNYSGGMSYPGDGWT